MKEFDLIDWIRRQGRFDPAKVPLGPGDDMAAVMCGGERILVTVDQVLDGTHFILAEHGAKAAGRKAMARNLSDVAAMAAQPLGAVASVALPRGFSQDDAQAVYLGMAELGDQFACPVVGGDIGSWDGKLAISVTVLALPSGIEPVLRGGARVGDAICVTGRLGGAWQSGRHLVFTPRVSEARLLAERYGLHAMIDLSDGLAGDLGHICHESSVGAEIDAAAVPIHPDVVSRPDPLAAAMGDGEDYELLFTLRPDQARLLLAQQPLPIPVTRIGTIVGGEGLTLIRQDGRREKLVPRGWEHTI